MIIKYLLFKTGYFFIVFAGTLIGIYFCLKWIHKIMEKEGQVGRRSPKGAKWLMLAIFGAGLILYSLVYAPILIGELALKEKMYSLSIGSFSFLEKGLKKQNLIGRVYRSVLADLGGEKLINSNLSIAYFQVKRFGEAIPYLRKNVWQNPTDRDFVALNTYLLSICYAAIGKMEMAIDYLVVSSIIDNKYLEKAMFQNVLKPLVLRILGGATF